MEIQSNDLSISCPRCASRTLANLQFMRRYDGAQDWFRCERCDHIFTGPKQNTWVSPLVTVRGREVA